MPEFMPFKGVRYNAEKTSGMDNVVAPPYDIISPVQQKEYHRKHPHNVIRLILGEEYDGDNEQNNKYTRAGNFLTQWIEDEILVAEKQESFYGLKIDYTHNNRKITMHGICGLVKLENFGEGRIFPHEYTLPKPKADRLNLIRQCKANLSPVFSLYSDKEKVIEGIIDKSKAGELFSVKDNNRFIHSFYAINEENNIEEIKRVINNSDIVIADGHHRYETALTYRDEMRSRFPDYTGEEKWNYVLMVFVNIEADSLTILPAHRLVRNMPDFSVEKTIDKLQRRFNAVEIEGNIAPEELMQKISGKENFFGIYTKEKAYIISPNENFNADRDVKIDKSSAYKKLDVTVLRELVLKDALGMRDEQLTDENFVFYSKDPDETKRAVDSGLAQIAFYLNPTRLKEVGEISRMRERMPQKATYFFPKLLSGLVISRF